MKVLLCRYKRNGDKELAPVYFNSATKTLYNSDEYGLVRSFLEILYGIENWINEGFGWIMNQ